MDRLGAGFHLQGRQPGHIHEGLTDKGPQLGRLRDQL